MQFFIFWGGFLSTHQVSMNSCHLFLHGDTLAGQYFSAVLRVRNVSAFSIQLHWRTAKKKKNWDHAIQLPTAGPLASTKIALMFRSFSYLFSFMRPCALVSGVCSSAEQPRSFHSRRSSKRTKKRTKKTRDNIF